MRKYFYIDFSGLIVCALALAHSAQASSLKNFVGTYRGTGYLTRSGDTYIKPYTVRIRQTSESTLFVLRSSSDYIIKEFRPDGTVLTNMPNTPFSVDIERKYRATRDSIVEENARGIYSWQYFLKFNRLFLQWRLGRHDKFLFVGARQHPLP